MKGKSNMEKKKVLIVVGSFKVGGAEKMAINVGEFLLREGYDVNFALLRPIIELHHNIPKERIFVLNRNTTLNKYLRFSIAVLSLLKLRFAKRPQVVIAFTYFSSLLACFAFVPRTIARFDTNPYPLAKKRRRAANFVFAWPFVRRVVVPSKGFHDYLVNKKKRYAEKVALVPNSVQREMIIAKSQKNTNPLPSDMPPYICALGRITHQKNYEMLINSYARSNVRQIFSLVIIGDGIQRDLLSTRVQELGLGGKVHFLGMMTNPFPVIKGARFLVNTSIFETFCNVILEALVLNVPVIATDCDYGPADMVQHGHNGFLVQSRNDEELVQILDRVAEELSIIDKMRPNAFPSTEKFALPSIGREWIKLIDNL